MGLMSPKSIKKFWRQWLKKFSHEWGWLELIVTTIIISAFRFSITKEFNLNTVAVSFSFSLALFIAIYASLVHMETYINTKDDLPKIYLDPKIQLGLVKEIDILHSYYLESINTIITNVQEIHKEQKITADPYDIYNYICHSARVFKKLIISVDLDLDAWFYVCENEDFEYIGKEIDTNDEDEFKRLKKMHEETKDIRRRIDPTWNISNTLLDRLNNNAFTDTVKRIVVLPDKNYGTREKIILQALLRINKQTKGKVVNKILYRDSLKEEQRKMLEDLQDIIVFDKSIAFKESLIDAEKDKKGEIIIDQDTINDVDAKFSALFKETEDIERD